MMKLPKPGDIWTYRQYQSCLASQDTPELVRCIKRMHEDNLDLRLRIGRLEKIITSQIVNEDEAKNLISFIKGPQRVSRL